jgi:hypothetical protein
MFPLSWPCPLNDTGSPDVVGLGETESMYAVGGGSWLPAGRSATASAQVVEGPATAVIVTLAVAPKE